MTDNRLGDAPIEPDFVDQMNRIAAALDRAFNGPDRHGTDRGVGFVLMVFPMNGHEGRCNFISNGAQRADLVALFKEMIARFEGQPHIHGHA